MGRGAPPILVLAKVCEQFGCLPSQVEAEETDRLLQVCEALALDQRVKRGKK